MCSKGTIPKKTLALPPRFSASAHLGVSRSEERIQKFIDTDENEPFENRDFWVVFLKKNN